MAWIEVHQSLSNHRKIFSLSDALNIPPAHAVGLVINLWLWALDNAEDGDLSRVTNASVTRAAQWSGNADAFVTSLVDAGFVDQSDDGARSIHNWFEYAGKLIEQRETQRAQGKERQRRYRKNHKKSNEEVTRDKRVNNAPTEPYSTNIIRGGQASQNIKESIYSSDH